MVPSAQTSPVVLGSHWKKTAQLCSILPQSLVCPFPDRPVWCWEWDAAAQVLVFSPGKQSRPRWCCCPCWESPTCCSLSTQGRMRSPGSSSSTSTPFWSPSRYGPSALDSVPVLPPRDVKPTLWLMPHPAPPPSQKQTSPNPRVAPNLPSLGPAIAPR